MSAAEIEDVTEAPNWMKELEAKRERRLKARLGHEAGAGAPCLTCEDKCPGLDLHFWRKICKICKCSKENHDVHDDDIYSWAQFELLGSKPNKIRRKIVLPGKKDEVELDWSPKGQNDTVDKYLKTLPPEALPVKGSQAAQDRKQLLQKQIPIHDIDPSLCHELTVDELKQMNEYIAHIKQKSVGVGQIISLSNVFKGNVHNINSNEASIIASRYAKGLPTSEIVKLLPAGSAGLLKGETNITAGMDKLNINNKTVQNQAYENNRLANRRNLPNFVPNELYPMETNQQSVNPGMVRDFHYAHSQDNQQNISASGRQFSSEYATSGLVDNFMGSTPTQFAKFDHNNTPMFSSNIHNSDNLVDHSGLLNEDSLLYKEYLNKSAPNMPPSVDNVGEVPSQFAENLRKFPQTSQGLKSSFDDGQSENTSHLSHQGHPGNLPHYSPGNYAIYSELQHPAKIPKSFKDLAFSTYDPNSAIIPDDSLSSGNGDGYHADQKQHAMDTNNDSPNNNEGDFVGRNETVPPEFGIIGGNKMNTAVTFNDDFSAYNPNNNEKSSNVAAQKKQMSQFYPGRVDVSEDILRPQQINIGAITDISYPEIQKATQQSNAFYEDLPQKSSLQEVVANVVLPNCHHCKKPFQKDEFAITIDHSNALYHAGCFKCAGCNQELADNLYFYHKDTDNIYCGRDYAKIRGIPRCNACDELIFTKEYCLAQDATFHLKHFCCFNCDTPLAGQNYLLEDSMPLCLPCFEANKADKCNGCLQLIKPEERGLTLNGVHFHASEECFACKICKLPLFEKKLLLRNEKLYCSHDCFGKDK